MVMVRKVSDLAAAHCDQFSGSVYYASVIRFLYTVCQAFPSVYLSTMIGAIDYLDHPVHSVHPPTGTPSYLFLLPLELLDHIFCYIPWEDLLRSCVTCRQWCQVATRFTHVHLVLCLSPDWQVAIVNTGGFASLMDEYALAQYMAMTYFIIYWGIAPYVLSVSYVNWPCLRVCFFYHLLPNVTEFICVSAGCSHRNISSVSTPFLLPPSIETVRLVKCTMQHHSVERMLRQLKCLHTLELRGLLHGHVVSFCFKFIMMSRFAKVKLCSLYPSIAKSMDFVQPCGGMTICHGLLCPFSCHQRCVTSPSIFLLMTFILLIGCLVPTTHTTDYMHRCSKLRTSLMLLHCDRCRTVCFPYSFASTGSPQWRSWSVAPCCRLKQICGLY